MGSSAQSRGVSTGGRAGVTSNTRLMSQAGVENGRIEVAGNSEAPNQSQNPRAVVVEPYVQNTANALPFGQQIEMVKPYKPQIVKNSLS